ncbi:uncharacterized protein PG986_000813 [Apiospora aurea]|uniref:Uncharacterized protein n=1 Tax=Apiospora aurea TaxID=335848 RepID=A0ABR1QV12_9PEZI
MHEALVTVLGRADADNKDLHAIFPGVSLFLFPIGPVCAYGLGRSPKARWQAPPIELRKEQAPRLLAPSLYQKVRHEIETRGRKGWYSAWRPIFAFSRWASMDGGRWTSKVEGADDAGDAGDGARCGRWVRGDRFPSGEATTPGPVVVKLLVRGLITDEY